MSRLSIIQEEIARRKALQTQSAPAAAPNRPGAGLTSAQIREEIDRRKAQQSQPASEPESRPYSYLDRAAQFAHGFAEDVGRTADFVRKLPVGGNDLDNPELSEGAQKYFDKKHGGKFAKALSDPIQKLAGRDLRPTSDDDDIGNFTHAAGAFSAPSFIPGTGGFKGAKTAYKAGKSALGNFVKRHLATSAGSAGMVHLTPKIFDRKESPNLRAGEDIVKSILGARVGPKALKGAESGARTAVGAVKDPRQALANTKQLASNVGFMAKEKAKDLALKTFVKATKPKLDLPLHKLAIENNIQLPWNVGMGSKPMNWIANNMLKKNIFTSQKYHDSLEKTGEGLTNLFRKGAPAATMTKSVHDAATDFGTSLVKNERAVEKQKSALYQKAYSYVTDKDTVVPTHTAELIKEALPKLTTDIGLTSKQVVSDTFKKVAKAFGIDMEGSAAMGSNPKISFGVGKTSDNKVRFGTGETINDSKLMERILAQLAVDDKAAAGAATKTGHTPIELERLTNLYQDLGKKTKYDRNIRGHEAFLGKLKEAVGKDIRTSTNKNFVDNWEGANNYMAQEVGARGLRDADVKKLLDIKNPADASNLVSSPQKVKQLERIAGKSPQMLEAVENLKRSKVEEMFSKAVSEDGFNTGAFARVLDSQGNAALLKSLTTPQTYAQLRKIRYISKEMSKAGVDMLNNSATGIVSSNIKDVKDVTRAVKDVAVQSMRFIAGAGTAGAVFGPVGAAIGAASGAAIPHVASKMLANPEFVDKMRVFALASQAGNVKKADSIFKGLLKFGEEEAKAALNAIKDQ